MPAPPVASAVPSEPTGEAAGLRLPHPGANWGCRKLCPVLVLPGEKVAWGSQYSPPATAKGSAPAAAGAHAVPGSAVLACAGGGKRVALGPSTKPAAAAGAPAHALSMSWSMARGSSLGRRRVPELLLVPFRNPPSTGPPVAWLRGCSPCSPGRRAGGASRLEAGTAAGGSSRGTDAGEAASAGLVDNGVRVRAACRLLARPQPDLRTGPAAAAGPAWLITRRCRLSPGAGQATVAATSPGQLRAGWRTVLVDTVLGCLSRGEKATARGVADVSAPMQWPPRLS